ncbi:MAG TPA: hypothetical protein VEG65_06325 [Candidatus Bathyarchaeia archaeon]|nr:hypothetical protein [Candidatus Bathyarchaeia archaeon]
MPKAKKKNGVSSCAIIDREQQADIAHQGATTLKLEEDPNELEKLPQVSDLQRAILSELLPASPCAIHSEVLLELLTPLLKAERKKDRRREFEAAVTPLVQEGLVRYFCCFIDSYALNPLRTTVAHRLTAVRNLPKQSITHEQAES